MRTRDRRAGFGLAAAAAACLVFEPASRACDVPVFRWALERWGPEDPAECYAATVFCRGPLDEASRAAVEAFRRNSWPEARSANLIFRTVDLSGDADPEARALWESLEAGPVPEEPWIVLEYPLPSRIPVPAWAGPLSAAPFERLFDSPLRREISKRILAGDAAVWLLVECGDAEKDRPARELLEKHLEKLEALIEFPRIADPYRGPGASRGAPEAPPFAAEHPSFSVVSLARGDPAEALFRAILLRTERDLETRAASEPAAFPLFGRGRTLSALVGKEIAEETVEEACGYLVGMCSCEFKAMNPGTDLPFRADWDSAARTSALPVAELIRSAAPPAGEAPEPGRLTTVLIRALALTLAALAIAVAAAAVALRRKLQS